MDLEVQKEDENQIQERCETAEKTNQQIENSIDTGEASLLDQVQMCPAVFKSQQKDDPDLSIADKRKIAEDLLHQNPVKFLVKFGEYLNERHLNYLLNENDGSYEVEYYVNKLKKELNNRKVRILKRNRRYEAMKRMEVTTSYFSEAEMEKREPLLYYQMVGQHLSEKEKMCKNQQANKNVIPSFANFIIDKIEKDELSELMKQQQEEEDNLKHEISSEDEPLCEPEQKSNLNKRWGDDWEDEKAVKKKTKSDKCKQKKKVKLNSQEKKLLLQEFTSIMQSNFLSGLDDFNYSEIDSNPEYDCLELRSQDEEEKYFDDETCDDYICTDTGIEDY